MDGCIIAIYVRDKIVLRHCIKKKTTTDVCLITSRLFNWWMYYCQSFFMASIVAPWTHSWLLCCLLWPMYLLIIPDVCVVQDFKALSREVTCSLFSNFTLSWSMYFLIIPNVSHSLLFVVSEFLHPKKSWNFRLYKPLKCEVTKKPNSRVTLDLFLNYGLATITRIALVNMWSLIRPLSSACIHHYIA